MSRSFRLVAYHTKLDAEPGDTLLIRRAAPRPRPPGTLCDYENELAQALADFEAMRAAALHTADLADYIAYLTRAVAHLSRHVAARSGDARETDRTSFRGRALE